MAKADTAERTQAKPATRQRRTGEARLGRPTAERVQAINRAIVDAARAHFLADGFRAASMEAIAATAGVSKSTLYGRYPTKEQLLETVYQEQLASWAAVNVAPRRAAGGLKEQLRAHARTIMKGLLSTDLQTFNERIAAGDGRSDMARTVYQVGYLVGIRFATGLIEAGTRNHPAPPRDAFRVAQMTMSALVGWCSIERSVRVVDLEEAYAYADHMIDVVFAGRSEW